MPGGGDFVSFFQPGGRSFALKSCPQGGDFDEKHYWPGGQTGGGTVTGQIDTCITSTFRSPPEMTVGLVDIHFVLRFPHLKFLQASTS